MLRRSATSPAEPNNGGNENGGSQGQQGPTKRSHVGSVESNHLPGVDLDQSRGSSNPDPHEYTYAGRMRRAALFLLGGVSGAALDQIHVQSGVLSYRSSSAFGQPWWVAPQFGLAAVAIAESARPFAAPGSAVVRGRTASDLRWFVGSYLATGLVRRRPHALLAAFVLIFVARMTHRTDRLRVIAFALLLAIAGSTYEHRLAGTGSFSYRDPGLGNVPIWLPGLYVQGAPLAIDLVHTWSAARHSAR